MDDKGSYVDAVSSVPAVGTTVSANYQSGSGLGVSSFHPYAYKLLKKVGTPREVFEAEAAAKVDVTEDVSLEQFVKDDTSPFPPRWLLIGVAIVAVFVAMALFT